jgi:putative serine protease PepD
MTGYEAAHQAARTPPGDPGEDGSSAQRLGPHPPRMEPHTGGFSPPPAPAFSPHRPSQTSTFPAGSFPTGTGSPAVPSQPIPTSVPTGAYPTSTPPGAYPSGFGPQPAAPRRSLLPAVTLFLVVLLTGVAVVQAIMLMDTRDKLDKTRTDAATERTAAQEDAKGLEERTKERERRAGNTLDAEAVAGKVLPSVFRVTSQTGTGTGFAFANQTPEGGTYIVTNYHVIDANWESGQKRVDLEQQNRRFTGEITKVDERADLAIIQVTDAFPRLGSAPEPAKPGQPVVVVGSPLGLEDSVTSGVISAQRTINGGPVLQFDAPVNPGNSGGPIVNAQGQVVGVVNAKLNNAEGISLGIPVAVVCQSLGIC